MATSEADANEPTEPPFVDACSEELSAEERDAVETFTSAQSPDNFLTRDSASSEVVVTPTQSPSGAVVDVTAESAAEPPQLRGDCNLELPRPDTVAAPGSVAAARDAAASALPLPRDAAASAASALLSLPGTSAMTAAVPVPPPVTRRTSRGAVSTGQTGVVLQELASLALVQVLLHRSPGLRNSPGVLALATEGGRAEKDAAQKPPTASAADNRPLQPLGCIRFSPDGRFLAVCGTMPAPVSGLNPMLHGPTVWVWQTWDCCAYAPRPAALPLGPHGRPPPGTAAYPTATQGAPLFECAPLREWGGHTAAILDAAWSRSILLLTASEDGFARLWHPSRGGCLHKFQHPAAVTGVSFHPLEDNFFVTGCADKVVRIWSLESGATMQHFSVPTPISAVSFSPDGRFIAVGTLSSTVYVYSTKGQLQYHTLVYCRNAKGALRKGSRVTGFDFLPSLTNAARSQPPPQQQQHVGRGVAAPGGVDSEVVGDGATTTTTASGRAAEATVATADGAFSSARGDSSSAPQQQPDNGSRAAAAGDAAGRPAPPVPSLLPSASSLLPLCTHLLVTTNDSSLRLFTLNDFVQVAKYKGVALTSSRLSASFDASGARVLCGSEDGRVVLWRTRGDHTASPCLPSLRPAARLSSSRIKVWGREFFSATEADAFTPFAGGSVTAAAFAPPAALALARPSSNEAAWLPRGLLQGAAAARAAGGSHMLLVVATSVGLLRVYECIGPPDVVVCSC